MYSNPINIQDLSRRLPYKYHIKIPAKHMVLKTSIQA